MGAAEFDPDDPVFRAATILEANRPRMDSWDLVGALMMDDLLVTPERDASVRAGALRTAAAKLTTSLMAGEPRSPQEVAAALYDAADEWDVVASARDDW